eukprot:scaffold1443_cov116-Isochrysis_galbana.AAC.5
MLPPVNRGRSSCSTWISSSGPPTMDGPGSGSPVTSRRRSIEAPERAVTLRVQRMLGGSGTEPFIQRA